MSLTALVCCLALCAVAGALLVGGHAVRRASVAADQRGDDDQALRLILLAVRFSMAGCYCVLVALPSVFATLL